MSIKIIYSANHPLAPKLSKLSHSYFYEEPMDFTQVGEAELVFDFTLLEDVKKIPWLERLSAHYKVISDTSCNWGEYLEERFDNLLGCMGTAFYSPRAKAEVHLIDEAHRNQVDILLCNLGLDAHYVSSAGHGFTYPRTISTLINEAYFALEDGLATREDMDQAMSFGVNYPHGLFEWSQKIGSTPILMLLQSLYLQTGNPRYRQAPYLKLESLK